MADAVAISAAPLFAFKGDYITAEEEVQYWELVEEFLKTTHAILHSTLVEYIYNFARTYFTANS